MPQPPASPSREPEHPGESTPLSRSAVRDQREQQTHELRQAISITGLSVLLPGLGLVFTRRRGLGALMALVALLTLGLTAYALLSGGIITGAAQFLTTQGLLLLLALFVVGGLLWVLGIMLTAQETAHDSWTMRTRWWHRGFAGALCLLVATPAAVGAQYVLITQNAFDKMTQDRFTGRGGSARTPAAGSDPWRNIPRVNILLIGSDAGKGREGVRTDTLMVASVDTRTGDTVLVSIPRNLQKVPFPKDNPLHQVYPRGYDCGTECLMDAIWFEAGVKHRDKFPPDETNPGLNTTREVVQEIVGLPIDYTTVVNLAGFTQLIDALGGVQINVKERLPIGGEVRNGYIRPGSITGWIEPGNRTLNGREALWYSRSRATTSDDDRMRRQRCMVNALVSQASPATTLQKFPSIMQVAGDNITFDIPQEHLPAFATLADTMKKGNMRSVNLTRPVIQSYNPDFAKIKQLVRDALAQPHDTTAPKSTGAPTTTATPTPTAPTGSTQSSSTPTKAITDTRASC